MLPCYVSLHAESFRFCACLVPFLDQSIELFASESDVSFASHHWPTWGYDNIVSYLSKQRDLYAYMHDQTLRLMNQGHTGIEIAEMIELPPTLAQSWHCRGYYGSLNHNVKAVYQRYMGWFDGNPAHLWPHPPEEAAKRYVDFMGGASVVLAKAQQSFDEGDYRWVAEVVNHVVFAEPQNRQARDLLAQTYLQLGFGSENATWRNFFLTGAMELQVDAIDSGYRPRVLELLSHLSVAQIFEAIAIRLDGPRAAGTDLIINWTITESGDRHFIRLENAVLSHVEGRLHEQADLSVSIPKSQMLFVMFGFVALDDLVASGVASITGEIATLTRLQALLDAPDPDFAIGTP